MSSAPIREVARRVFAREFNDSGYTFKESDDERAPVYLLLPTGERANRIFVVGTLTETEDVGEDSEYWRGRVVDPTGTFFVYAGQYQPEAANVLREIETPKYVSVVGKPRTYETNEGDINVAVRPESITVADAATRDRWVTETAQRTIARIEAATAKTDAEADADAEINEYTRMAAEQYDRSPADYREAVVAALEELDGEDDSKAGDDADAELEAA